MPDMRPVVPFLLLAIAASGAAAQPRSGPQTLQMDSRHAGAGLTWNGAKTRFTQVAGALEFDPANPLKSTIALSLDAASIESEAARKAFDPDRFPEMRIISTADAKPGKGGMEALPVNVTIHDITHPILLQVRFNPAPVQGILLHAEGTVRAADFRLGTGDVPLVIDAPFMPVSPPSR